MNNPQSTRLLPSDIPGATAYELRREIEASHADTTTARLAFEYQVNLTQAAFERAHKAENAAKYHSESARVLEAENAQVKDERDAARADAAVFRSLLSSANEVLGVVWSVRVNGTVLSELPSAASLEKANRVISDAVCAPNPGVSLLALRDAAVAYVAENAVSNGDTTADAARVGTAYRAMLEAIAELEAK